MIKKIFFASLIFFSCATVYAEKNSYTIDVDNDTTVTFLRLNQTCKGGVVVVDPLKIPPGQKAASFLVEKDANVGCVSRYNDQKGVILGIWIRNHEVTCSNEGGFLSYHCKFVGNLLTISP